MKDSPQVVETGTKIKVNIYYFDTNEHLYDQLLTSLNELLVYFPNVSKLEFINDIDDQIFSKVIYRKPKEERFSRLQQIDTIKFRNLEFTVFASFNLTKHGSRIVLFENKEIRLCTAKLVDFWLEKDDYFGINNAVVISNSNTHWKIEEVDEIEQEHSQQLIDDVKRTIAEYYEKGLREPKLIVLDVPTVSFKGDHFCKVSKVSCNFENGLALRNKCTFEFSACADIFSKDQHSLNKSFILVETEDTLIENTDYSEAIGKAAPDCLLKIQIIELHDSVLIENNAENREIHQNKQIVFPPDVTVFLNVLDALMGKTSTLCIDQEISNKKVVDSIVNLIVNNHIIFVISLNLKYQEDAMKIMKSVANNYLINFVELKTQDEASDELIELADEIKRKRSFFIVYLNTSVQRFKFNRERAILYRYVENDFEF